VKDSPFSVQLFGSITHLFLPVAFPKEVWDIPVGNQNEGAMKQKTDVLQGTLALMVLKTLDVLG